MLPIMALTKYDDDDTETFANCGRLSNCNFQTSAGRTLTHTYAPSYPILDAHKHTQTTLWHATTANRCLHQHPTHTHTRKTVLSSTQQQQQQRQWSSLYPHSIFISTSTSTCTSSTSTTAIVLESWMPPHRLIALNPHPRRAIRSPGLRPMPRQSWPYTSTW